MKDKSDSDPIRKTRDELLTRMGMPLEDAVVVIGRAGSAPDRPA